MTHTSPSASSRPDRIYLDHAATAWPKCERATEAAFHFVRNCGATAGRGSYTSSQLADRWLETARVNLARLIGAASGSAIAICNSGTHALNVGLQGLMRAGQHVISTDMEHNSVLRPLQALSKTHRISVSYSACDAKGVAAADAARELIQPNTRWICVGHASNVTGAVQDLQAWRQLAVDCGARLFVDASQTLGYVPIDVRTLGIDVLATAGHKGLRALPGSGFLYVEPTLAEEFEACSFGGTGRASESIDAVQPWPASVEVGNLNMLGVISMAVAAEDILADPGSFSSWQEPFERLRSGLSAIDGLRIVANQDLRELPRVPLLSLVVDGWDVHDLAAILDASFGIEARAGLHCAALVHSRLGTHIGGTLRLSTGHATSVRDVDSAIAAFKEILS